MKRVALIVCLFAGSASAQDRGTMLPPPPITGDPTSISSSEFLSSVSDRLEQSGGVAQELEAAGGAADAMGTAVGWVNAGVEIYNNWQEYQAAYRGLDSFDETCMDVSTAGAPEVPSNCADEHDLTAGSAARQCGACYTEAVRRINKMRTNLERLRCVYSATKRYSDASIAFGNSVAPSTGIAALEWENQKKGIVQAMDNLKIRYAEKYGQMMPNLRESLDALGQCEAQFFQNNDWYSRFGFIYYTFMADRYKLHD